MRIFIISNYYPPHYIGGYELACHDVANILRERGHEVHVLTSTYGVVDPVIEDSYIYRWLPLHPYKENWRSLWKFAWDQFRHGRKVMQLIHRLSPDIIYLWNMRALGSPLLTMLMSYNSRRAFQTARAEYSFIPIVFAFSDWWAFELHDQSQHWIEYWQYLPQHVLKRIGKSCLQHVVSHFVPTSQESLSISYAHFFSHSLRRQYAQHGIIPQDSRIIYHGIRVKANSLVCHDSHNVSASQEKTPSETKLLYCGRLDKIKGVHTAIEAISILVNRKKMQKILLTIIGPQEYPEYVSYLRQLIKEHALQDIVSIHDKISRERLERIYQEHDYLIFPSIWEEPFSITILEAMAYGLAIISTATGGSAEILKDGENSLIFPPEDAHAMANQIELFIREPNLVTRIRENAFKLVRARYSSDTMVTEIEQYLKSIVEANHQLEN